MQTPERVERQRSPFAAAFFSSIQPGLGQVYAGRWARGLAWAAPTILFYAFTAGVIRSMGLTDFAAQFLAPSWLLGLLVFLVIDLIYRIVSAVDAFRVASQTPARKRSALASFSIAGLIAVVLVMALAHVALGQTVFGLYNLVNGVGGDESGDQNNGPDASPNASLSQFLESILPNGSIAPTPTEVPGATPTPVPTATQGDWQGGDDRLNILLIGSDAGRANVQEYLTDTMMVLSIDPPTGRMALISLPRDTQGIPLPSDWPAYRAYGGSYPNKINTLYTAAKGAPGLFPVGNNATRGFDALKGTLGQLYGIKISYYVAVDLLGFRDVINTLGGVMIDVQIPVYDPKYPANEGKGSTKLYIPPGIQFMDGSRALSYARSRHTTDDFDRAARQQRVLTSVREQTDLSTLLAPGVINQLFSELKQDIRTDIPPELFPQLVGLAQKVDFNNRISLVLTPPTYSTECYQPIGETGPNCPNSPYYLLIANVPAIRNAVHNVFDIDPAVERQREQISAEAASVSVLNGTPSNNATTTKIADTLTTYGINAIVPPVNSGFADRRDYTNTVITAWNGAQDDDSTTLSLLAKLFKVTPVTADDPTQTADITVVVGTSTQPPPRGQ
jgi:LCP family protein required for cell wall assembly